MKTTDRVLIPGGPHHLMRRSLNKRPIFRNDTDYAYFIDLIRDLGHHYEIQIHAWCLLPDCFHLLVTPGHKVNDISTFMKALTCRLSLRHKRMCNEPVHWEPRYRSSPVEPGQWLMACMRYIEHLPVARSLVRRAFDYPQSSYRMRLGKSPEYWLDDPEEYLRLGKNLEERSDAYRAYMGIGIDAKEAIVIASALTRGSLTGSWRFVEKIYEEFGVLAINRGRGRPPKYRPALPFPINPYG